MNDLRLALSYETASGAAVGIIFCLCVLFYAYMAAARHFKNPAAQRIFLLSIALRFVLICLSVLGLFNAPSADLVWFEIDTARISQGVMPFTLSIASADNFEAFQAAFAYVCGPSFFLADALGLIGFMLSVIALGRFIRLLKLDRFESWILLPFCFLPGSLIYLNYNTREIFQVLFLILMMHSLVQYRISGQFLSIAKSLLFGYLFAVSHNRYIVVVPAFIGICMFLPNLTQMKTTGSRILVFPFALGLLLLMFSITNSQGFLTSVSDTGLVNYVADLSERGGGLQARTQFPFLLTSTDTLTFLLSLPVMMVQFLCAPIVPPVFGSAIDIFPLIDTAVRMLYLYGTWRLIRDRTAPRQLRDAAMIFLFCYFLFCGISLLGTLNVGTQQRHQIAIEWVLLIAGAPVVASMFGRGMALQWKTKTAQPRRAVRLSG